MTERPILFNAPMVRAILDGRKTMTRRVVKPLPDWEHPMPCSSETPEGWQGPLDYSLWSHEGDASEGSRRCPYGQPGDRLWVREAWRIGAWDQDTGQLALDYCDGPRKEWITVPEVGCDGDVFERYWIQSTNEAAKVHGHQTIYYWKPGESPCRWRPSIHMPRWASRITLEITAVRVERLNDISEQDAKAEGARECDPVTGREVVLAGQSQRGSYALHFRDLWESINGPGSWALNPFVWVVEFKKL